MDTKLSIAVLCLLVTLRTYTALAVELTFSRSGQDANRITLSCLIDTFPAPSPTFYTIIPGSSQRLRVDSSTVQDYQPGDEQVAFTLTPETEAEFSCESQGAESSSVLLAAFRPVDRMQGQIQHVYTGETAELECVIQPGRAKELYSVEWHRYNQRGNFVFPPLTAAILPDGPHLYISPSNFSLFVAIENISQNGTACQCSVAIEGCSPDSHPGCSSAPRYADGPRITLIVEEHQPTPSTSPTMPFPPANPPEGTSSSPPPGGTTSSPPPPPVDTPSTPPTEPLDVEYIITVCVPAGLGVIVIIAVLGFTGCVTVCCVRRKCCKQRCQAENLESKADKLEKEVSKLVKHLSSNTAKRRKQEDLIDDKRQQINRLRNQATDQRRENYRIANELRERANRIQTEVTELQNSNLKKREREKVIKAKEKEIKSLRKQASVLSDAGEDDVDGDAELDRGEDDENECDATCRSTTNPHVNGRTDYATVDGSIHIEIPEEVLFKESCL